MILNIKRVHSFCAGIHEQHRQQETDRVISELVEQGIPGSRLTGSEPIARSVEPHEQQV